MSGRPQHHQGGAQATPKKHKYCLSCKKEITKGKPGRNRKLSATPRKIRFSHVNDVISYLKDRRQEDHTEQTVLNNFFCNTCYCDYHQKYKPTINKNAAQSDAIPSTSSTTNNPDPNESGTTTGKRITIRGPPLGPIRIYD